MCWAYDYERTPALTPEQLVEFTGRPRSTLYRHLKQLREMQWIRIDQAGWWIVVRPVIPACAQVMGREAAQTVDPPEELIPTKELLQALADIGVENPKRNQLAGLDIDPLWVHAWQLWTRHPHRRGLTNPVGNIILKLESGERPPRAFLRAAEEEIRLRHWIQQQEQADRGVALEEQDKLEPEEGGLSEARRIWTGSLEELRLQMTRATFDAWLRGSEVVETGDGCLTVAVRHAHAVDWLQHRLLPVIERTVSRHAGGELKIIFVAKA